VRREPYKYRRIYERQYGPIPLDEDGRSFEIHHIDGDRTNNDPSNLVAMSIREHYDVHYRQGDYGACYRMAIRMSKTPEEISDLAKKTERIEVSRRRSAPITKEESLSWVW
jgi:hypothetical protein